MMTDSDIIVQAIKEEESNIAFKMSKLKAWIALWPRPDGYITGTFELELHDLGEE